MDSIGQISQYPQMIYRPGPAPNQAVKTGGYNNLSQLEALSVLKSQEADLSIVTQDGDLVTISADTEFRLDFATYDQTGRMRGINSRLHLESLSMESSQEFSMSVQGDLNEQETKDIQKVLQSLGKIMDDLLSGRMDQVLTRTEKLGDLDSLSSIEATIQMEQSISASSAVLAQTASSPYQPTNQPEDVKSSIDPNPLNMVQQRIIDALRDKDLSLDKMSKIIDKLFLKLSRVLVEKGDHPFRSNGMLHRLRNNLLKEIRFPQ